MGTHIIIFYIIRIIISWIINSYFIYEYTPGLAEEMEQQELKEYSYKDDIRSSGNMWQYHHKQRASVDKTRRCR